MTIKLQDLRYDQFFSKILASETRLSQYQNNPNLIPYLKEQYINNEVYLLECYFLTADNIQASNEEKNRAKGWIRLLLNWKDEHVIKESIELDLTVRANRCFLFAVQENHLDLLEAALSYKADVNYRSGSDCAIMLALRHQDPSLIQRLIDEKVNLNIEVDGTTPLFYAAKFCDLPTVQCLVGAGADINRKVGSETPLSIANYSPEIFNYLANNQNLAVAEYSVDLQLEIYACRGSIQDISRLLTQSPSPREYYVKKAITFARNNGFTDIVELLSKSASSVSLSNAPQPEQKTINRNCFLGGQQSMEADQHEDGHHSLSP